MKIFRTVFRIDYPISFGLVDKLGEYVQATHIESSKAPFEATQSVIGDKSMTNYGTVQGDKYRINLTLKSMDLTIEHIKGIETRELARHPAIEISHNLLNKIEDGIHDKYLRFGVRTWILSEDTGTFVGIRDKLKGRIGESSNAMEKAFGEIFDVGVILEGKDKSGMQCRVCFGPYQKEEYNKYFTTPPSISQGFISDIDIYESNIQIVGFDLKKLMHDYQGRIYDLARGLTNSMKEKNE